MTEENKRNKNSSQTVDGAKNAVDEPAPHPKDNEEQEKILSDIKEVGGPKDGTTKHGDWSLNGKAVDFQSEVTIPRQS